MSIYLFDPKGLCQMELKSDIMFSVHIDVILIRMRIDFTVTVSHNNFFNRRLLSYCHNALLLGLSYRIVANMDVGVMTAR